MTVLPVGIEVGIIPKLQEGERRVFYVDVGNMSPEAAMRHLLDVRNAVEAEIKDETCLCVPVIEGGHRALTPGITPIETTLEQSLYTLRGKTLSDEEFASLEAAYLVHKATRSGIQ